MKPIRVSYGFDSIPSPSDPMAGGGIVKFQALQERFPNTREDPDVLCLVSSRPPPDALALIASARERGARILFNQAAPACPATHDTRWQKLNEPLVALLHAADHVFYQSHFSRRIAARFLGERQGPSEILYNAVDTSFFTPATSDPDPHRLIVLLGGSQFRRYRLEMGLRAFANVLRHRPDAHLLVTGQLAFLAARAEARRIADGLIQELGIGDHVTLLGPYPQDRAPQVFQRAHVLIHPMYLDCCPTVLIEAMACGLPVAYGASGGAPELVGPDAGVGVHGDEDYDNLHPPDPEALAQAVLSCADRRRELGEAGRARAVERFDRGPWLRRYIETIERLASTRIT